MMICRYLIVNRNIRYNYGSERVSRFFFHIISSFFIRPTIFNLVTVFDLMAQILEGGRDKMQLYVEFGHIV